MGSLRDWLHKANYANEPRIERQVTGLNGGAC